MQIFHSGKFICTLLKMRNIFLCISFMYIYYVYKCISAYVCMHRMNRDRFHRIFHRIYRKEGDLRKHLSVARREIYKSAHLKEAGRVTKALICRKEGDLQKHLSVGRREFTKTHFCRMEGDLQ